MVVRLIGIDTGNRDNRSSVSNRILQFLSIIDAYSIALIDINYNVFQSKYTDAKLRIYSNHLNMIDTNGKYTQKSVRMQATSLCNSFYSSVNNLL